MKIDKELRAYYEDQICRVNVPPRTAAGKPAGRHGSSAALKLLAAAVIALCFIPLYMRTVQSSVLAERAAVFCEYHELNTRIPAGLVKISNYYTFQGGEK